MRRTVTWRVLGACGGVAGRTKGHLAVGKFLHEDIFAFDVAVYDGNGVEVESGSSNLQPGGQGYARVLLLCVLLHAAAASARVVVCCCAAVGGKLRWKKVIRHAGCRNAHVARLTRHTSHVTRHTSHVTRRT